MILELYLGILFYKVNTLSLKSWFFWKTLPRLCIQQKLLVFLLRACYDKLFIGSIKIKWTLYIHYLNLWHSFMEFWVLNFNKNIAELLSLYKDFISFQNLYENLYGIFRRGLLNYSFKRIPHIIIIVCHSIRMELSLWPSSFFLPKFQLLSLSATWCGFLRLLHDYWYGIPVYFFGNPIII